MLSGSVLGTAVLLDGITQRIEEELGRPATLVVTGGLAKYVTPLCRHPLTYDPELLLKGRHDNLLVLPLVPEAKRTIGIAIAAGEKAGPATRRFADYVVRYVKAQA